MSKQIRLLLMILAIAALPSVGIYFWFQSAERLPPVIRIAAGKEEGLYDSFAKDFARQLHERTGRPVQVIETAGSDENLELLREGKVELALIQTVSLAPEGVVGIAPLFEEPLYFITRKDKKIRSMVDLEGKRVALGLNGSSMRRNSLTLLTHYDLSPENMVDRVEHFSTLETDQGIDAALVTTGWMNPIIEKLLHNEQLQLVEIADADVLTLRYPWLKKATIPRGLYPNRTPLPPESVQTVAVTALLSTRADTSERLVAAAMSVLYETDIRATYPALYSAKEARDYDAAVMHSGVAKYHDPNADFKQLSDALELLSKSKEAIFGLVAFTLLIWGWIRRRRERAVAAADELQKTKLDHYIEMTLSVELEQMDFTEPETLRKYLRKVTHIKQDALKELTSEKVRGDQLFAIFLSQCAALSEKIQMRMIYARVSEKK
ncbi:MAG: TAXI family TRAP transporter solute-binding subunit [Zavarzinella sp.]